MEVIPTNEISNFYLKLSSENESIQLIENIEFTNEFKKEVCLPYLKDIYKDLCTKSDSNSKGISRVIFMDFLKLPGLIGERLFNIFDMLKDNYIDQTEFITGMFKIFSTDFHIRQKFIFDMYDFDKDGFISREDVRTLLSSVSFEEEDENKNKNKKVNEKGEGKLTQMGIGLEEFKDRALCQEKLNKLTDMGFKQREKLNLDEFKEILEKISSDMFICPYLMLRKSISSVTQFNRYIQKSQNKVSKPNIPLKSPIKILASPKILNKLKPAKNISNTFFEKQDNKIEFSFNFNFKINNEEQKEKLESSTLDSQHDFGNKKNSDEFLEAFEAVRLGNTNINNMDLQLSPTSKILGNNGNYLFCTCGKEINDLNLLKCEDCIIADKVGCIEGEMYKISKKNTVKKSWFVLEKKEIHCYSDQSQSEHKGMHILSGCFLEDIELAEKFGDIELHCFILYWGKKFKKYGTSSLEVKNKWIGIIKRIVGYANIRDYYILGETIGNGKFSVVKMGTHIKSQKKVAVKIIKKIKMNEEELELQYREIEILKLCQHPNIIRLLDIFESKDYLYLILEYLEGGDLFAFLESKKFKLPETFSSRIIHSISAALYYLHSFGIVHRDLKPENILLVDKSEKTEPKIVDFGLSKMIGPQEKCNEPFGTLSYVAPEVLEQNSYGKPVDIWSLGVISYLMLAGYLPFDSDIENEVARMTMEDTPDFISPPWDKISYAAIDFVRRCLNKNPNERITLKTILQHTWLLRENSGMKKLRKNTDNPFNAFSLANEFSVKELEQKKANDI